jgi:hypothetical protein
VVTAAIGTTSSVAAGVSFSTGWQAASEKISSKTPASQRMVFHGGCAMRLNRNNGFMGILLLKNMFWMWRVPTAHKVSQSIQKSINFCQIMIAG